VALFILHQKSEKILKRQIYRKINIPVSLKNFNEIPYPIWVRDFLHNTGKNRK
jgi:hypothetical protein